MRKKKTLIAERIDITGSIDRTEIVRRVINTFIEFESEHNRKDIMFMYPVEDLIDGNTIYIVRPTKKYDFDFKISPPSPLKSEDITYIKIGLILRKLRTENERLFNKIWNVIQKIFFGEQYEVNKSLDTRTLKKNVDSFTIETLLKCIKWMFILEDIYYWNYEGRNLAYNFIKYVVFEENNEELRKNLNKVRVNRGEEQHLKIKPQELKKWMKNAGIEWKETK